MFRVNDFKKKSTLHYASIRGGLTYAQNDALHAVQSTKTFEKKTNNLDAFEWILLKSLSALATEEYWGNIYLMW